MAKALPGRVLLLLGALAALGCGGAGRVVLESPYRDLPNWYKGQLHCHSSNSDGALTPAQLEAEYAKRGFDFICITDHDAVTPDPSATGGQEVGVFISGEEHTTDSGHMVLVGVASRPVGVAPQLVIDEALTQGAAVCLAHPNGAPGYSDYDLTALKGYSLIEVWNESAALWGAGEATGRWDYLLSGGRRVWGAAADDFHSPSLFAPGQAYVVVNSEGLSREDIVANLGAGNFYASRGATLQLAINETTVTAYAPSASRFVWKGYRGGTLRTTEDATSDSYAPCGGEGYVRVEVTRAFDGKRAWSQPVFVGRE